MAFATLLLGVPLATTASASDPPGETPAGACANQATGPGGDARKLAVCTDLVQDLADIGQRLNMPPIMPTTSPLTTPVQVIFAKSASGDTLPSGQATLSTAWLQVGTHALVATYGGDGNFLSSTSTSVSQVVRCMTVLAGRIYLLLIVSGSTCINNATVNGAILVQPGAALSLTNSTVNGAIISAGAKAVTNCADTLSGASAIGATSGFVLIGDNGDHGFSCGGTS